MNFISDIQKLGSRQLHYYEKHHIIPKSVDKTFVEDKLNIIELSGREHFEAHKLLLNCFNGKNKSHMYYSYNLMCNSLQNANYNITPEDYECFREEFHKICIENNTGKNNPRFNKPVSYETRQKLSKAEIERFKHSDHPMKGVSRNGALNPMFGKKQTEETKKAIGKNSKGRIWINNGVENKFVKPEELEYYNSIGFIYIGCLMAKKNDSNK